MKIYGLSLKFILIFFSIFLFNCDKDSTKPEPASSSISVSGDISESYAVMAFSSISTYSSDTEEKEYFTVILQPESPGNNDLAMTLLYTSGPERPETGSYTIGEYAFGDDIPVSAFGGSFSGRNVTDLSAYFMSSGTLTISESSVSKICGEVAMNGYYAKFTDYDTTRTVTVTGKFKAIPMAE